MKRKPEKLYKIGGRNWTKVLVLLYLNDLSNPLEYKGGGRYQWAAVPDIARYTASSRGSLGILLKRWQGWGLVEGRYFSNIAMSDSRPHWMYRIGREGQNYLGRLNDWYPHRNAARSYLNKVADEKFGGYTPQFIITRGIAWHIKPSDRVTVLEYPFETKYDTHFAMGFFQNIFKVQSLGEAASLAYMIFRVKPTHECLQAARNIERYYLNEAIKKLQQKVARL
jgi:hypothetical protein